MLQVKNSQLAVAQYSYQQHADDIGQISTICHFVNCLVFLDPIDMFFNCCNGLAEDRYLGTAEVEHSSDSHGLDSLQQGSHKLFQEDFQLRLLMLWRVSFFQFDLKTEGIHHAICCKYLGQGLSILSKVFLMLSSVINFQLYI